MTEKMFKKISPLIAHLAWCCYQMGQKQPFNVVPKAWQTKSLNDAAAYFWENPKVTPRKMHSNWMQFKLKEGWTYGKVKNPKTKKHPCIAAWDSLPAEERNKDVQHIMAQRVAMVIAYLVTSKINSEKAGVLAK